MIRYKLNILEAMRERGYTSYRVRRDKILGENTMQKIRTGNTSINLETLDILCGLLECQPGDLIERVPNE